jgi:malonate-semialdehyde dehydrogenase (acetylating)/methylmalonate-semialdehyde dehydrogenase
MALSVVLAVGDKTADDLCARLEKQIAALRVGPGLDQTPENEMGPLISSAPQQGAGLYRQRGSAGGDNFAWTVAASA